jgi:nitroimidazol reductase NimA-like FMN-containing flavoprotein (pyridoxamine 5'-phosphate oxidase superfamily)
MPTLKPGDKAPAFTLPDQNAVNKPGPLDNLPEVKGDLEPVMRERLGALFGSQRLAVLSSHRDGQPYSNLVAFVATPDLRGLVFATTRATRKFENLTADPRVSMLIDNRSNQVSDFREAMAVTAVGRVKELSGKQKSRILDLYLGKHPYLKEFVESPTCAPCRWRSISISWWNGFKKCWNGI